MQQPPTLLAHIFGGQKGGITDEHLAKHVFSGLSSQTVACGRALGSTEGDVGSVFVVGSSEGLIEGLTEGLTEGHWLLGTHVFSSEVLNNIPSLHTHPGSTAWVHICLSPPHTLAHLFLNLLYS
jgi:hypothetical protein